MTSSNSLSDEVSMMMGTWLERRRSRQTVRPPVPGSFEVEDHAVGRLGQDVVGHPIERGAGQRRYDLQLQQAHKLVAQRCVVLHDEDTCHGALLTPSVIRRLSTSIPSSWYGSGAFSVSEA